ncbi:DUF2231 domain-containing protein [Sphingomonas sp.]|uniref:DUF2231 domain-containing protein n=1 Tax=Sphingomonas sp. TaxID=28214 RepID=UPI0017E687C5|nr:DUF2231 domain-containing protein [Sphingomonas sp.]MBA3511257.1 hypothetical protein [Sphingomonas sp.]
MVLTIPTHRFTPLMRLLLVVAVLLIAGLSLSPPAQAHEQHRKQQQLAAQQAAAAKQRQAAAAGEMTADQMHETMGEMMMEPAKDRSQMSLAERVLDWLGRFHPIIVHFPIAFFPAALFTAIVGRRRPAFSAPVQFLVVAGGIIAPLSALLGWFNGGWVLSDADPLLAVHRWLGTGIGLGGLLLGIWAWRRPWEDRGAGMIVALTVMTIAIAVQGWFGGALVHGAEHLNW